MSEPNDFFDQAEEDQEAHDQNLRDFALNLLSSSTMNGDDDGLEEELIWGQISPQRWSEIFLRLAMNQMRVIDLPNCGQTEFSESFKDHGIKN